MSLITVCGTCLKSQLPAIIPGGDRYGEPRYSNNCHETEGCCGSIGFFSEESIERARAVVEIEKRGVWAAMVL